MNIIPKGDKQEEPHAMTRTCGSVRGVVRNGDPYSIIV